MTDTNRDAQVTETCSTCRFFVPFGYMGRQHECRRFPPQTLDMMKPKWPYPNTDDFCGEHQPKDTGGHNAD